MGFDQAIALGVGLEVIGSFCKRNPRLLGQRLADPLAKLRMGIDTASDRSSTDGQFIHRLGRHLGPLDRQSDLPCISPKLLAQSQRGRVHQVRSTDLDDAVPSFRLLGERGMESLELWDQSGVDLICRRDMDRRREGVVGTLSHVDMVVRMDRLDLVEPISSQDLNRSIRDHFVDVHVARCS